MLSIHKFVIGFTEIMIKEVLELCNIQCVIVEMINKHNVHCVGKMHGQLKHPFFWFKCFW